MAPGCRGSIFLVKEKVLPFQQRIRQLLPDLVMEERQLDGNGVIMLKGMTYLVRHLLSSFAVRVVVVLPACLLTNLDPVPACLGALRRHQAAGAAIDNFLEAAKVALPTALSFFPAPRPSPMPAVRPGHSPRPALPEVFDWPGRPDGPGHRR